MMLKRLNCFVFALALAICPSISFAAAPFGSPIASVKTVPLTGTLLPNFKTVSGAAAGQDAAAAAEGNLARGALVSVAVAAGLAVAIGALTGGDGTTSSTSTSTGTNTATGTTGPENASYCAC